MTHRSLAIRRIRATTARHGSGCFFACPAAFVAVLAAALTQAISTSAVAGEVTPTEFVQRLTTPLREDAVKTFRFELTLHDERGEVRGRARLQRNDHASWSLAADTDTIRFSLQWTPEATRLEVPKHGVAFVGHGAVTSDAKLHPKGLIGRLFTPDTAATPFVEAARQGAIAGIVGMLPTQRLEPNDDWPARWRVSDSVVLELDPERPGSARVSSASDNALLDGIRSATLRYEAGGQVQRSPDPSLREVEVERAMLDAMVVRGVARLLSVRFPAPEVTRLNPPAETEHGVLLTRGNQTVALLWGSPEDIGRAHGALLAPWVRRTIDSTLYMVGLGQTVNSGRWFPDELAEAHRRTSPHVPDRHKRELRALAAAMPKVSLRELELTNVFPEYFHCSGFAVFGPATADGTLFHGRVLDYMTKVGLQQTAVTFVVRPEGQHAFMNIGYAGFLGSVTGMNTRQIGVGEMGGRGQGLWDGTPMATLMRRALEEASSLDQAKSIFADSPRTCEYFYILSDAKIPDAVGIAATPDHIEFVAAGAGHGRLGPGIPGVVVLSEGSRLDRLRRRIQSGHGRLDAASALRLMDRPVAMSSNLHNALLAPGVGKAWVAQASADRPAAEMPYVELDLRELLDLMPPLEMASPVSTHDGSDAR